MKFTISSQGVHCYWQDYLEDNQNQVPGKSVKWRKKEGEWVNKIKESRKKAHRFSQPHQLEKIAKQANNNTNENRIQ